MTKTDIYKRNQRRIKICRIASPIVFWVCLALCVFCLYLALQHSIGNIQEICDLLDKQAYTGEQLEENYNILVEKYGEWQIGGASGGFTIVFINLRNAVFNGFALLNAIGGILFGLTSGLLGKWLLPLLAKRIEQDNQDMVNLTILEKEN